MFNASAEFVDVYVGFARYISLLYLVFQGIIICNFCYSWSDRWVQNYFNSGEGFIWAFWLVFFSSLLWVGAITFFILDIYWFAWLGCDINIFVITFTPVVGVVFTVLSVTPLVKHGSLLTSSGILLY